MLLLADVVSLTERKELLDEDFYVSDMDYQFLKRNEYLSMYANILAKSKVFNVNDDELINLNLGAYEVQFISCILKLCKENCELKVATQNPMIRNYCIVKRVSLI